MKTNLSGLLCLLFMMLAVGVPSANAQSELEDGPDMRPVVSIDVQNIKNKTDQPRANFQALIDRLNHELVQTSIYQVMNMEDVEETLKKDDAFTVIVGDDSQSTFTRPVFYIRMVVTQYGVSSENIHDNYTESTTRKEVANVELILTLVDARTAVTISSTNIQSRRDATITAHYGMRKAGNYAEQALQAACKVACEKIVRELVKYTPFYVLDVDGNQVTTDIPPSVGQVGALFDIFQQGKAIRNRRTGKVIRSERKIATIQLISVSGDFSTGVVIGKALAPITTDCIIKPSNAIIQQQLPKLNHPGANPF